MPGNFRGLMAPVLTPFKDDRCQSINLSVIPQYAKYLQSVEITGVLVNGTSGEGMSMTCDERKAVTEAWTKATQETKQTLMVQVGGACLKDVKDMAKHCEELGVGSLLCLPDLFNKPSCVDDLVSYLENVASAAPKTPLLYYHLPAYTGVNLEMSTFLAAAHEKIPTFAGAKYTHTDLQEGVRCLKAHAGKTSIFLGCDEVLAGAFALGFDSAIATTLNLLPRYSQKILAAVHKGDFKVALNQQRKLNEAIAIITKNGGWVATMKAAMSVLTPVPMGEPRAPLKSLTAPQLQQLAKELKAAGFDCCC